MDFLTLQQDRDGKTHVESVHVEDVGTGFPKQYVVTSHRVGVESGATANGASDSTHLTDAPQRWVTLPVYMYLHLLRILSILVTITLLYMMNV